jgi:hypothetical protein
MAKTFIERFRIEPGSPLAGAEPGFSVRTDLKQVGFPVTSGSGFLGGGDDLEELPSGINSGAMGQIKLDVILEFGDYVTDFQPLVINNNVNVDVEFQAGIPQPCLLDADGNGIVSRGDIDNIFTQNLGLTASEIADTLSPALASTLDLDQDGVVTIADYQAALEQFIGVEGCVQQPDLSNYPKYLDLYPNSVAYAYSLRKLRDSYDGPCMTVKLDIDARCFNGTVDKSYFFRSLSDLGPDFETLPDPAGDYYRKIGDYFAPIFGGDLSIPISIGGVEDQVFTNVRDAWNFFTEIFDFLKEPLEIPFTDDGYIDYALIELLMEDPLAAYGIKDQVGEFVQNEFYNTYSSTNMHAYQVDPIFGSFFNLTFKEKAVVLIDTWFDQREDEQRNMVGTVTKANEWGMHPFGMTSLLVGRFGKVMRRDGKFMIGNGTLTGLGDKAHLNRTGEEFGITEMLADEKDLQSSFSDQNNVMHGCSTPNKDYLDHTGLGIGGMTYASPGTWAFPNGNDDLGPGYPDDVSEDDSMVLSSWPTIFEVVQYYNYPSETPVEWQGGANPGWIGDPPTRFKKMQWQVGTAYLTQEKTNAEYINPFYESDATLWEPSWLTEAVLDGDPVPGYENPPAAETGNTPGRWWTGSKGKRTSFGTYYTQTVSSGTQGTLAIGYLGAHPGMYITQPNGIAGYTDQGTPGFREFRETGTNPYNGLPYPNSPITRYAQEFPEEYPEFNAFIDGTNAKFDPHISLFRSDQFNVVGQEGVYTNHVYRVDDDQRQPDLNNSIDPGIPATMTSAYSQNFFITMGNYRGFDLPPSPALGGGNEEGPETFNWSSSATSRNPDSGGNIMEWVAWNDKLPLQAGIDYIEESKRYFENKKIQQ